MYTFKEKISELLKTEIFIICSIIDKETTRVITDVQTKSYKSFTQLVNYDDDVTVLYSNHSNSFC